MALADYSSVQTNTFIKIDVDSDIWLFSDLNRTVTFNGDDYIGTGQLMSLTSTSSELRQSSSEVTITLSGIPNSAINEIVTSSVKGSPIKIYRAFFDVITEELLVLEANPMLRYRGYINNYSLNEEYNVDARNATNTIQLICASALDQLNMKMSGRKTNPGSFQKYLATDKSMSRVPNLENATFDFGAP